MNKILPILLLIPSLVFAQSQYDYYDDDAAAGGVDNAVTGIVILFCIAVIAVVCIFIFGGLVNIY